MNAVTCVLLLGTGFLLLPNAQGEFSRHSLWHSFYHNVISSHCVDEKCRKSLSNVRFQTSGRCLLSCYDCALTLDVEEMLKLCRRWDNWSTSLLLSSCQGQDFKRGVCLAPSTWVILHLDRACSLIRSRNSSELRVQYYLRRLLTERKYVTHKAFKFWAVQYLWYVLRLLEHCTSFQCEWCTRIKKKTCLLFVDAILV